MNAPMPFLIMALGMRQNLSLWRFSYEGECFRSFGGYKASSSVSVLSLVRLDAKSLGLKLATLRAETPEEIIGTVGKGGIVKSFELKVVFGNLIDGVFRPGFPVDEIVVVKKN